MRRPARVVIGAILVAALAAHPVRTALLLAASPGEDRSACAERVGLDLDGPGELR